jgi:predicted glycosyl hydrolase (DUF1957 family)
MLRLSVRVWSSASAFAGAAVYEEHDKVWDFFAGTAMRKAS